MLNASLASRSLVAALASGLLIAVAIAAGSLSALTLTTDEAWLLLSIQGLAESGVYGHRLGDAPTTTGGLYTLAEWGLFRLAGPSLPVLRLLPFFCFVLLLFEMISWARRAGFSGPASMLPAAVVLAMPGTLAFASASFGVVPATLLMFAALRLWTPERGPQPARSGRSGLARRLAAGAVVGLAAATRPQLALMLPVLLFAPLLWDRPLRPQCVSALAAVTAGSVVFLVCSAWLISLTSRPESAFEFAGASSGLVYETSSAFAFRKWTALNQFLPLPILAASLPLAAWLGTRLPAERHRLTALAWFGALSGIAWIAFPPVAHLRYVWPGLAAVACVLGFGLAVAHDSGLRHRRPDICAAAILIGIVCAGTGCAAGLRNLLVGDLNVLTLEWREKIGLVPEYQAVGFLESGQAAMAQTLRELDSSIVVGAIDTPYELEFLAQRPLTPLAWYAHRADWAGRSRPSLLLRTPDLGRRTYLSASAQEWLDQNCAVEARHGDHILCRVTGRYPDDLRVLLPSTYRGR